MPAAIQGPLFATGHQLRLNDDDPLFTQRLLRSEGSDYIFSLVALPKSIANGSVPTPQQLSHPEARIITAAIHLDLGPDSEVAVQAAGVLLPMLSPLLEPSL